MTDGQRPHGPLCRPAEQVEKTGEKFTKESAEYKKGAPFHRCGICEYYRAHRCSLVTGDIEPMMGCKFFEKA